jgi:uncharacterized C2H2 Zn-finger protein
MSKPINLNRRGTPRKGRLKRSRIARRKECPKCGKKFHTRSSLLMHVDRQHLERRGLLD